MRELMEITALVGFWVVVSGVVIGVVYGLMRRPQVSGWKERWVEQIRCPECTQPQEAEVTFLAGMPYPAYAHQCIYCEYWITESDWETV